MPVPAVIIGANEQSHIRIKIKNLESKISETSLNLTKNHANTNYRDKYTNHID